MANFRDQPELLMAVKVVLGWLLGSFISQRSSVSNCKPFGNSQPPGHLTWCWWLVLLQFDENIPKGLAGSKKRKKKSHIQFIL